MTRRRGFCWPAQKNYCHTRDQRQGPANYIYSGEQPWPISCALSRGESRHLKVALLRVNSAIRAISAHEKRTNGNHTEN